MENLNREIKLYRDDKMNWKEFLIEFFKPDWKKFCILLIFLSIFLYVQNSVLWLRHNSMAVMAGGGIGIISSQYKACQNVSINESIITCREILMKYATLQSLSNLSSELFKESEKLESIGSILSPNILRTLSIKFADLIKLYVYYNYFWWIFNFVYWYILSCIIVFVYNKLRR